MPKKQYNIEVEELLESIDIKKIEAFIRKKKLQQINGEKQPIYKKNNINNNTIWNSIKF